MLAVMYATEFAGIVRVIPMPRSPDWPEATGSGKPLASRGPEPSIPLNEYWLYVTPPYPGTLTVTFRASVGSRLASTNVHAPVDGWRAASTRISVGCVAR